MERSGDAVRQQLRLSVLPRDLRAEAYPWPRLQLALKCVTVKVDNAWQHQQSARIKLCATSAAPNCSDMAVLQPHVRYLQAILRQQYVPAGYCQPVHLTRSQGSKTI